MENLLNSAKKFTVKNLKTGRKSKKSGNDYLVEIMKNQGLMERDTIVLKIAIARTLDSGIKENELNKAFGSEKPTEAQTEMIETFTKLYTTAKNGVDTSIAQGKQKSNFCNSDYSTEYDLVSHPGRMYELKSK